MKKHIITSILEIACGEEGYHHLYIEVHPGSQSLTLTYAWGPSNEPGGTPWGLAADLEMRPGPNPEPLCTPRAPTLNQQVRPGHQP